MTSVTTLVLTGHPETMSRPLTWRREMQSSLTAKYHRIIEKDFLDTETFHAPYLNFPELYGKHFLFRTSCNRTIDNEDFFVIWSPFCPVLCDIQSWCPDVVHLFTRRLHWIQCIWQDWRKFASLWQRRVFAEFACLYRCSVFTVWRHEGERLDVAAVSSTYVIVDADTQDTSISHITLCNLTCAQSCLYVQYLSERITL